MAKVTSKLQVTLPKALAEQYAIKPGDEIEFSAAGEVIRIVPPSARRSGDIAACLRSFDAATARLATRPRETHAADAADRGWTREDLYDRGRSR